MDTQRLRNLTTGRLHTEMGHVYEDLESIIGQVGLFTHMLPGVLEAVTPWLRATVADTRFWNGEYDPAHTGEYDLPTPTAEERVAMLGRYSAQPSPLSRILEN
jgi:hypothetical protein